MADAPAAAPGTPGDETDARAALGLPGSFPGSADWLIARRPGPPGSPGRPVGAALLVRDPDAAPRLEDLALGDDPDPAGVIRALMDAAAGASGGGPVAVAAPVEAHQLIRTLDRMGLRAGRGPYRPIGGGAVEFLHGYTGPEGFFIDYEEPRRP